jgi:MoxR-like ATPase
MSRMIEISEELYQDIVELANIERQPPDVFAEQLLREHIDMLSALSLQSKIKERKRQLHRTLSSMDLKEDKTNLMRRNR